MQNFGISMMTQEKPASHVVMREQEPSERIHNFQEVPLGYSPEEAIAEARRCLQCKKPLCVTGCPVNVQIPQFIKLIVEGKFAEAARKIKETNALPAVCGRVCPQETQCEAKCILGKKSDPIAVGHLERFCADFERDHGPMILSPVKPKNGKKIGIVGSGPAGLTAAGELIKEGFEVTIFEALHEPGGVLQYGIPEFRLPKDIVKQEIDYLLKLGVRLEKNFIVGKTATID
jgi:glutamate synthase (NADPH/NADH) small chain